MSTQAQPYAATRGGSQARKRVLFLCLGNACRSQMAEGFARAYGEDVIVPASAGLTPAMAVADDTIRAMEEKDIDLRSHFPKSWLHLHRAPFDLVVNLSGFEVPLQITAPVRVWKVADPFRAPYEEHCRVRDQIENLVMGLILEFRREQKRQRV